MTGEESGTNPVSRRDFLKAALTAVPAYVAARLGIPATTRAQDTIASTETPVNRESENFIWPEDVRGNEEFFGNDILITIDDCYDIEATQEMVALMKECGARATFFPNTGYLNTSDAQIVALWRDIRDSGFDIGYHTVHHESGMIKPDLAQDFLLFTEQMRTLLDDPNFTIQFVRPPEGNWNEDWMDWVRDNKLTNVRWNFVPNADDGDVDYYKAVMENPNGGNIILLHPRRFDTSWLATNLSELQSLADEKGGEITSLTGNG